MYENQNDINLNQNKGINLKGKYDNIIKLNDSNNKEYFFHANNSKW